VPRRPPDPTITIFTWSKRGSLEPKSALAEKY
jgi:hypothetical protein